ncbi:MAG: hypothetical protein HQL93_02435 [Magnetococcales bacterium]|nr:hypothetical protein [Magnetococcales bacterium]
MIVNQISPGQSLYRQVRGGFVIQGGTLTAWCRQFGINPSNARAALTGAWDGQKGRELREKLIEAAKITVNPN